jgi:RNA polymerase sigma-70 factor (ECF subfamily)
MGLTKVEAKTKKTKTSLQEIGLNFYKTRSEKDFTTLYYRLLPGISYVTRKIIPDYDDRSEVVAITFAKVWSKIDQYDPYWNFSTWAYKIAHNESLLFLRKKKNTYSYEGMEEMGINMESKTQSVMSDAFADEPHIIDTLHDAAVSTINMLPDVYREVLSLREIQNKKYEEIADLLGWKQNTVRTRIRKARELVREHLLKNSPELIKEYNNQLA